MVPLFKLVGIESTRKWKGLANEMWFFCATNIILEEYFTTVIIWATDSPYTTLTRHLLYFMMFEKLQMPCCNFKLYTYLDREIDLWIGLHVFREGNQPTDWLVGQGVASSNKLR